MGVHYLERMFSPRSVAVYGASDTADPIGHAVFQNILASGYGGDVHAINLRHKKVADLPAVASACEIGKPVDLAVITTSGKSLQEIIRLWQGRYRQCSDHFAGLATAGDKQAALLQDVAQLARKHKVRLLGPNLFGLMRPRIGLNASTFDANIPPGNLALVSQSTALASTILDWAHTNQVGFSSVVSLARRPTSMSVRC